jgi:hypothetical protein
MKRFDPRLLVTTLSLLLIAAAGDAPALYTNDFSKLAPGKLPEDQFLALAGQFEVKDVDGNRVLELAGTPIDSFGVLFGPAPKQPATETAARIFATPTGKRVPEFGVGCGDAGGYRLWLMPRTKQVAIRKAEQIVATAPYDAWKAQTWTRFRLAVAKADGGAWTVRGKVWQDGTDEPKDWTVSFNEPEEPASGRASVWGTPYAGTPVRFDDLSVK